VEEAGDKMDALGCRREKKCLQLSLNNEPSYNIVSLVGRYTPTGKVEDAFITDVLHAL
jgi:hypothetical protein